MKKNLLLFYCFVLSNICLLAQTSYPVPDYSNEIYLVKKDTTISLIQLKKKSSKQEMKMKIMGINNINQSYSLKGEKSPIRLQGGSGLVFILYTGEKASSNPQSDSMMRANGMDPDMMSNPMGSTMDLTQMISLYSMAGTKGQRKALTQSMGLIGKSKKTATKYTLSIKKVKEGYHEMIVDKTLPKGEYTFVMSSMSMDQSFSLFAFAVD